MKDCDCNEVNYCCDTGFNSLICKVGIIISTMQDCYKNDLN